MKTDGTIVSVGAPDEYEMVENLEQGGSASAGARYLNSGLIYRTVGEGKESNMIDCFKIALDSGSHDTTSWAISALEEWK